MKTIEHHYTPEHNLINVLAESKDGVINQNFINGDNTIYQGTHFILKMEDGLTAIVIDTVYKEKVLLKYHNENTDFIGMYYYVTNQDINFILNDESNTIGQLNYNLAVIDSRLDMEYIVEQGAQNYVIGIMIDKKKLETHLAKAKNIKPILELIFDAKKNTIVRLDRISSESIIMIKNFRKQPYSSSILYEMQFRGLIYDLLGNYFKLLAAKKIIISKVLPEDLKKIIISKKMILENIENPFLGLAQLSTMAGMSSSKYKQLFTKITGESPGSFYSANKLNYAKELLESKNFTVNEIVHKLNYSTMSYFAKCFNEMYGMLPKEYQTLYDKKLINKIA